MIPFFIYTQMTVGTVLIIALHVWRWRQDTLSLKGKRQL